MNRRAILIGGGAVVAAAAGGVVLGQRGAMAGYAGKMAHLRAWPGPDATPQDLIRYATLAANSHNTQPWRFRLDTGRIDILPDPSRRTPVVDPDDHHLFVSLGCAAENLALAGAAAGLPGEIRVAPDAAGLSYAYGTGPAQSSPRFEAIARRQSTRADYDRRAVPAADLVALAAAADIPGCSLSLLTEPAQIDRIRDLVIAGNSAQMADPAFLRELKGWLRFTPASALRHGDGLFSAAGGNPVLPEWLAGFAFDLAFKAKSENDKYARQIRSSAGIAVFTGDTADPEHWIRVGQACQRFALTATALGLKHAFVNQPVEVPELRPELAALIGAPGQRPDLVMRFGYGPQLPFAPRRPVAAVLER